MVSQAFARLTRDPVASLDNLGLGASAFAVGAFLSLSCASCETSVRPAIQQILISLGEGVVATLLLIKGLPYCKPALAHRLAPVADLLILLTWLAGGLLISIASAYGILPCSFCIVFWIGIALQLAALILRAMPLLGSLTSFISVALVSIVINSTSVSSEVRQLVPDPRVFFNGLAAGAKWPDQFPQNGLFLIATECAPCMAVAFDKTASLLRGSGMDFTILSSRPRGRSGASGQLRLAASDFQELHLDPRGPPAITFVRNGRIVWFMSCSRYLNESKSK